uniref:ubiquitinyl hydrolase 1 n=1 Tax=Meloidogyne enterolobii TaxID=390850 RepID=A0A6V7VX46_MELEN|nr:unnamed protein product [Meloidogyne enterolobii]
MSGTMDFPLESRFKSKEDYIKALNAFYRGDKPVTSIDNSSNASDLDILNYSDNSSLNNNINQDSTKLSSSDGSLNKKRPVKLFGPKENSGSMPYNHRTNNSGRNSELVSPIEHPLNSSFNLNPTSEKTDQNGNIEMVSADNTKKQLSATASKGSHKNSECSKGSRFQTHSSEYKSNKFADSKRERNQQKPHSVYGKPPDTVTTRSSEQYNSVMDFDKNSNFNHKNPQKTGNSCNWPISKLCPPDQNTSRNNQVVANNYPDNEYEHITTHSSEQNICEKEFVPKPIGIPCLKGLKNHGNTCYFNALMQSLAGCDRLAEFLLCKDFDEDNRENGIFDLFLNTIRCMWFNDRVDEGCRLTIHSIAHENPAFCVGYQHDTHECMIWLLNKLNREILDFNLDGKIGKGSSFDPHIKMIKNNEVSTLLKLFQGQFRHEIKCTTPTCNFVDTSTEPFLSVSLSVPLPRKYTVKFICMNPRKITRFHFDISESGITVKDIMEAIEKTMKIKPINMVACKIEPDGQSYLVPDNVVLESYSQLNDFTILGIPGEIHKQYEQQLVIAIVNYVFDGKIFGEPYLSFLFRNITYDKLCLDLMKDGEFLLPQPFYQINPDFKLVLLNSANGSVYCSLQKSKGLVYCHQTDKHIDPATLTPLKNEYVNRLII